MPIDQLSGILPASAGFRKEHSTFDNIFVLNGLISLYQSFGKKIFCTFVDFRKFGELACG
jgi:hypothetical protein